MLKIVSAYHKICALLVPTKKRIRFPCNSITMPSARYMLQHERKGTNTTFDVKQFIPGLCMWISYLLKLQLRVDSDIAYLTVEGAFLSVWVRGQLPSLLRAGFRTQAWVCFYGSQTTSGLQDSFVFGTLK